MLVAISLDQGKIPARFGDTTQYMLCQISRNRAERTVMRDLGRSSQPELVRTLMDDGVNVLVAGGIGRDATQRILDAGIMLYPNCKGTADEALGKLQEHRLVQLEELPQE